MTFGSMFDDPKTWETIRRRAHEIDGEGLAHFRAPPEGKAPQKAGEEYPYGERRGGHVWLHDFQPVIEIILPGWYFTTFDAKVAIPFIPSAWDFVAQGVWHSVGRASLLRPALPREMLERGFSIHPDYLPFGMTP